MFHDVPGRVLEQMRRLETMDTRDRSDGTSRLTRLRQVPPETGQFIALLAACAPPGRYLEIGTSAGYSTLWLALACRLAGRKITTFEILDEKAELAMETFAAAGVGDVVHLVHGDALDHLGDCADVSFCFLDAEKEIYAECYETVVPNMVCAASSSRITPSTMNRHFGQCSIGRWAIHESTRSSSRSARANSSAGGDSRALRLYESLGFVPRGVSRKPRTSTVAATTRST